MRGVAVLTITGVLSQLVGFVYRIGLTRLAGAEILGLYQLILPVYSVLLSLTSVGLTTAVSNLSAWYQALGNQRAIYQVRGQAVKLFFLLAFLNLASGISSSVPCCCSFRTGPRCIFWGTQEPSWGSSSWSPVCC